MNLIRKLIRNRSYRGRDHKIRGLSTAELVGIIIIVGILGAIGGTYIGSLVNSANSNAIAQNINSLNTVCASMLSGGVPVTLDASGNVTDINGKGVANAAALIADLNNGITYNGVTYQMNPQISLSAINAGTYVPLGSPSSAADPATAIAWSQASGVTTP